MYDRSLRARQSLLPVPRPATLDRIVLQAHRTGLQVAFHATGDRAIDMAINAVEAALNATRGRITAIASSTCSSRPGRRWSG